ncbi:MAG: hypothetical protein JWO03_3788 [Bacteroidetes bacterium]|nr:hypothetical protein [Bacteroidota bacterium]
MGKIFQIATAAVFLLILSGTLFSCSQRHPGKKTNREWTVKLKDSIGVIHITLPLAYDTMHSWKAYDDNPADDHYYYRIQSSKASLIEESGFLKNSSDSLYQLTILHPVMKRELLNAFEPHAYVAQVLGSIQRLDTKWHTGDNIDTGCLRLSDHDYAYLYEVDTSAHTTPGRTAKTTNTLSAATVFNDRFIIFAFESTRSNQKDTVFIKESLEALKTIRFEKAR